MSLNEILFKGGINDDGLHSCYGFPSIEIIWDHSSLTSIRCKHGVFEGGSDMDLDQGVRRAMESFIASLATGIHNECGTDCAPPPSWQDRYPSWGNNDAECGLLFGHEGEHRAFDRDEEDAYWAEHRVRYINGRDVTGNPPR